MQIAEMFGATYLYVMLRALQQRNVAFDNYWWIPPVSMCMAVVDVFIVAYIAHAGWSWSVVLPNGLGGMLGALTAMKFHKRYIKK